MKVMLRKLALAVPCVLVSERVPKLILYLAAYFSTSGGQIWAQMTVADMLMSKPVSRHAVMLLITGGRRLSTV